MNKHIKPCFVYIQKESEPCMQIVRYICALKLNDQAPKIGTGQDAYCICHAFTALLCLCVHLLLFRTSTRCALRSSSPIWTYLILMLTSRLFECVTANFINCFF